MRGKEKEDIDKIIYGDRRLRKEDTYNLWIVPYADFMSILMVFFLLMFVFAYSSKNDRRYENILMSIQAEMMGSVRAGDILEKVNEQKRTDQAIIKMGEMIEKQNLEKYVTVNTNSEQIKIVLKNPVLFSVGKADLKAECRAILHEVAEVLKTMENEVIVEGHTDDTPIWGKSFRSNWELSDKRALAVIRFFTEMEGLPPERFAAAGYGEYQPLYPNDTSENRALNRRIEIAILRKQT